MSSEPRVIAPDTAIRVEGLSKHYQIYDRPHHRLLQTLWRGRRQFHREFRALDNVSFELARGDTLGIIGRNGAGKSTLLQMICGTLSPTAGSIEVNGRIAALLELGTGFNPDFTGRDNIAINAAILGLSPHEIAERTDDILAFADIGEFIDQPVKTYSSGMYVRLAFAVVIHVSPDILVVDEALAVGDALFQAKCMTRMRRMLDDGLTLLFISHDVAAVKAICHRALWLEKGRMRALGDTADITRDYAHDWVREANAAQGVALPSTQEGAGEHPHDLVPQPDQDAQPQRTGTGAVQLTEMGWSTEGPTQRETIAHHGDTLTIRARLVVHQPCDRLVVSYHIKNRQNQHVMGAHTADRAEVYGRAWQPGDVAEIVFRTPVLLHEGQYSLTMLAASMGDVRQYTDAVFHDWIEDVAVMSVAARNHFPLSDMVEVANEVEVRLPSA